MAIAIIDHARTLELVRIAGDMNLDYTNATGQPASDIGILLSALTIATDNIPAMAHTRIVIDYRGYAIEFADDLLSAVQVIDHLETGLIVLRDTMEDEAADF